MGLPKTVEERVGILEQAQKDCAKLQKERNEGMEKRVARLEYLIFSALATGLATLISVWIKK